MNVLEELEKAIKTKNLILFVGAGYSCSAPLNLPSWQRLISLFIDEIKISIDDKAINNIMQALTSGVIDEIGALDVISKRGYRNLCLDVLKREIDINFSGINLEKFQKLWKITDQIITTNYDCALEESLPEVLTFSYTDKAKVAKLYNSDNYLFKIHGSIKTPEECVLFRNTYENLYKNNRLATNEISNIFSHKTVLFVGFGLTDPYITDILLDLQKLYEGNKGKHFILTTKDEDFSEYDVETIKLNNWNELDEYINKLVAYKESVDYGFEELIKKLDSKGKTYDKENLRKNYENYIKSLYKEDDEKEIINLIEEGKYTEAEISLKTSLDSVIENINEEKVNAGNKAFKLAELNRLQLKFEDALYYYEKACLFQPDNILYLKEYSYQLLNSGEFKKAQDVINDTITHKTIEKTDLIDFKLVLGRILVELGYHQQSLILFQEVQQLNSDLFGENSIKTIGNYNSIGTALRQLGRYEDAISAYETGITRLIQNYPNNYFGELATFYANLSVAWANLAWPTQNKDFYRKSLAYAEDALKMRINIHGEKSISVAICYNSIALANKRLNNIKEAINYYNIALNLVKLLYNENHPRYIDFSINLAAALRANRQVDESIKTLTTILPKAIVAYGENNTRVGHLYINLGYTLADKGFYVKAVESYEKGLPILSQVLADTHPTMAQFISDYESLKSKM